MKKHVARAAALCVIAAAVAGCSSGVKLDEVPVETRTATAVAPGLQPAQQQRADTGAVSRVAPVQADSNAGTAQGPVNVPRVVLFDYDSYVIKPEYQPVIDQHARFLRANANRNVVIEGHTDERGGREYNIALGQRRSEAVRRALTLLGVQERQVEAVSLGEEKPAVPESDERAWSQNRRAEISYR